jgi:hypothetical protein
VLGAGVGEAVGVAGVAGGTVVAVVVVVVTGERRLCAATAGDDLSGVAVNWLVVIVSFNPVAAREVEDVRPVFVGACGATMAAAVALMMTGEAWCHWVKATVPDPTIATSNPRHVANAPPPRRARDTAPLR